MSIDVKLKVTEIQRFCMHDGPGVRTTVFLKGCPLRCAWCHNPETQKMGSELLLYSQKCVGCMGCLNSCSVGAHSVGEVHEIDREKCVTCFACSDSCPTGALEKCGTDMTVEEILKTAEKDRAFYGEFGGLTVSGGEPFAQKESALELLKACRERGISTAVETCGYADTHILEDSVPFVDLFLWDIKDTDDIRHKKYTGVSNKLILENLKAVNNLGANIRLRCILVKGVNTDERHYNNIAEIARTIAHFDGVEFIPYHAYGGSKAVFLGLKDNGNREWIPSENDVIYAKEYLASRGICVL